MKRSTPLDDGVLRLLVDAFAGLRSTARSAATVRESTPAVATGLAERWSRYARRYDVSGLEAPPAPTPDVALATRALEGDSAAVREIWQNVEGVVLGRIYAMGLARHEDELLPLVMDRIWDKLSLYTGSAQASLRTWVWTLTGNTLRNWMRDQKTARRRSLPVDGVGAQPLPAPPQFAADYDLAESERQASRRRMLDRIARVAADTLRPDEWNLVQRVLVRGEKYDVIAKELGELPGTLRARVSRALQRLREPLMKELGREAREYFSRTGEHER
jgi:RNA polymerase sigma factor (sigma-70 family)